MHPDPLFALASQIARADREHAALRRALLPRPRPPSRLRRRTAQLLVRAAARLAQEPVVVLPRAERLRG